MKTAKCINIKKGAETFLTIGHYYEIIDDPYLICDSKLLVKVRVNNGSIQQLYADQFQLSNSVITKTKETVIRMKDDIKNFIVENRTIIYWVAILIVADQWIFEGKFREKLQSIFESLITKVKKQLDN